MAGRLEGRVAVVTGGGNGIGRACCERFAEEGALVVVADLLDGPGKDTVTAIGESGGEAQFVHLDAADPAQNDDAMRVAVESHGRLDVLVTAAGIRDGSYTSGDREGDAALVAQAIEGMQDPSRRVLELDLDDWQKVIDVNLTGTLLALRAAARIMAPAGRGSIITIASVAAKQPEAGPLPYAVSKAAVWMLTKSAARSLGPSGVRVNAIGPGFIETNMTRVIAELPAIREQFLLGIPLRRLGQPIEVANTALFLASDESSYFTGELLHPDGGFYTD